MSALVTKQLLSGGIDGEPISITGILISTGTTIHTAHASALDNIFLKASNTSSSLAQVLVLQWGGITVTHSLFFKIPTEETLVIAAGDILTNSKVLKAFTTTASVVNIQGYVDRYTP